MPDYQSLNCFVNSFGKFGRKKSSRVCVCVCVCLLREGRSGCSKHNCLMVYQFIYAGEHLVGCEIHFRYFDI